MVVRSSMPSAWVTLAISNDTGAASSRASATRRLAGHPELREAVVARPASVESPGGRPEKPVCRSFIIRSLALVSTGASAIRSVVERGGQRQHVEAAHRDDLFGRDVDERVALGGVQLDSELAAGEPERVAQRSMDLRDAAIRQRILQVARHLGLPDPAAGEQLAQPRRPSPASPAYGRSARIG